VLKINLVLNTIIEYFLKRLFSRFIIVGNNNVRFFNTFINKKLFNNFKNISKNSFFFSAYEIIINVKSSIYKSNTNNIKQKYIKLINFISIIKNENFRVFFLLFKVLLISLKYAFD